MIDDAIPDEDGRLLAILVALVVVLGVLKALFMVGRRFIAGSQALGVEFDMRNALYGHLLRLSFRFFDRHQTGQLMSRATVDLQNVRFFLGYGLIFLAQHVADGRRRDRHPLLHRLAARPDRARDHARCSSRSRGATATSPTRCCATCSSGSRT